jgi:dTDP-glucose 4,6-dehydratase
MTEKLRTIVVTGGAGFIGGHLVRALIAGGGIRVVNLDALTYAADQRLLEPLSATGRYVFEHADIRDAAALARIFAAHQPAGVIHLAAESHVDRSIESPAIFVETNVLGTARLLEASLAYYQSLAPGQKSHFRFVHVSTDEVFGSLDNGGFFHEQTAYDPSSPYSASKASSDHMARAWARTYGLPVLVTNCSNNYGPAQFPEKLIPLMIIKAWRGEELPVYGKGENVRDWLHVSDHADALWRVFEQGVPGETYCIGGHNEQTNLAVVHAICDGLDRRLGPLSSGPRRGLIRFVTDRPGHDARYAIDAGRIGRDLNWKPRHTFEQGLDDTIDWYLANESWWKPLIDKRSALARRGLSRTSAEQPSATSAR